MDRIKVVVAGAGGRMGRMLVEAVLASDDCALAGALDVAGSPAHGQDCAAFLARASGVLVTDDVAAALAGADVLIDFTRPEGTLAHLAACRRLGVAAVVGTTGFDAAGKAAIAAAAREVGVVFAPNFSVGVNLAMQLVETAARALGPGYDVEVVEAHHRHKVDAPSGTALGMGEAAARGLGRDHDAVAVFDRHGHTGARRADAIGYAVVRGGDLVGDHTVMFLGDGERVEITHKASSRATYAQGALRACRFLRGRGSGLFSMRDVLGIS
ncbi:MAG: 4-hydroxy-tetrahydrodipicolinate reductase [Burkholderiales bacterium]|nr:4-hydroxy-tetrahydrodipicolinate reductase [Burkholderiales bacterium]